MTFFRKNSVLEALLLTFLLGLVFFLFNTNRPFSTPDEARYVEIAREMVATGDYLTPRLNGIKYFEKPVLFYWIQAWVIYLFGLTETSMRAFPALFSLAGAVGTYLFGRAHYGRRVGVYAALILATTVQYYSHSRIIILDMPVAVLMSLGLLSFYHGIEREKKIWILAFFAFSALGVLTKGLMVAVLSGGVILLWSLLTKRFDALKWAFWPVGIALFFAIAAPWHIWVSLENPEFAHFYFIHEQFLRFLTTVHHRVQPWYFFLGILAVGFFPWVIFLGQAIAGIYQEIRQKAENHQSLLFLAIWAGVVLIFFSVSKSKLIPYILPLYPPLSLIVGRYLARWERADKNKEIRYGLWTYTAFCSVLIVGIFIGLHIRAGDIVKGVYFYATIAAGVLAFSAVLIPWVYRRWHLRATVLSIAAATYALFIALSFAWPYVERPSLKPLAEVLKERLTAEDQVLSYGKYFYDLPVYLNRTVTALGKKGELEFGSTVEDVSAYLVPESEFDQLWRKPGKSYMVLHARDLKDLQKRQEYTMHILKEYRGYVLVEN